MKSGQVVRIAATDPRSVRDFEAFSRQTGNALLSTAKPTARSGSSCSGADARGAVQRRARASPAGALTAGLVVSARAPPPSRFPADRAGRRAGARRSFGAPFWTGVERLVYYVLFPALLFRSLATSPLSIGDATPLVGVGVAVHRRRNGAARRSRAPLFRLPHPTFAACFQCAFRFNTYVALAAQPRRRPGGVTAISLLVGVLVPLVNVAAVAMLVRGGDRRFLPALARNPLVIACAAGIAWHAAAWPVPGVAGARAGAARRRPRCRSACSRSGAGLRIVRGTLPAGRSPGSTRSSSARCPRSRGAARRCSALVDGRAPGRRDHGRGADGDVGVHPRDADERRRARRWRC